MVLDSDDKIFTVYIAALVKLIIILIYSSCKAQVGLLRSTKFSAKYFNFSNIFLSDSTMDLSNYTRINNHLINFLHNKQPPHSLIYSLELMKLKMLKIYIKANLANNFIKSFKSTANISIFFVWKKNGSFYLHIDY